MPKDTQITQFGSRPSLETSRFHLTEVQMEDASDLVPIFDDKDNQAHIGVYGNFTKDGVNDLINVWMQRGRKSSFWWKITN